MDGSPLAGRQTSKGGSFLTPAPPARGLRSPAYRGDRTVLQRDAMDGRGPKQKATRPEREQGMDSREAILHAAMTRFRPIMMTTTAALLGAALLRHWRRARIAPAAWSLDRRRPGREPGAHALHHAGRLSLSGPPGFAGAFAAGPRPSSTVGWTKLACGEWPTAFSGAEMTPATLYSYVVPIVGTGSLTIPASRADPYSVE
jgi:AcrB/AcrD/AcrF family protein